MMRPAKIPGRFNKHSKAPRTRDHAAPSALRRSAFSIHSSQIREVRQPATAPIANIAQVKA
jgi:hypothetical protein